MLKETLLEIVNIDYETKHKDIEIYGQNITTKALSIYNKFKKNKKTIVVFTEDKKEAEELFSIIFSLEKNTYLYPEIDILKRFDERSKDLEYVPLEIL